MAEQASSFMRDWIASNIHDDPTRRDGGRDERVVVEMARLKEAARDSGVDLDDPELRDDLLHDEIAAAIENVRDPEPGRIRD